MTSSKISQLAALMRSQELVNAPKSPQQENSPAFGALLSQTADSGKGDAYAWNGKLVKPPKVELANQAAFVKGASEAGYKENPVVKGDTADIQGRLPEDTQEKLEAFGEKATEAVAEELGVTEEEVRAAMESLGITVLDLANPAKLASLIMEVTGSEDISSLLVNEGFQELIGELGGLSQELMSQLNLAPEEMEQVKGQLEAMLVESPEAPLPEELEQQASQPETAEGELAEAPAEEAGRPEAEVLKTPVEAAAAEQKVQDPNTQVKAEQADAVENPEDAQEGPNKLAAAEADAQQQETPEENSGEGDSQKSLSELAQDPKADKAESRTEHHQVSYQTTAQTVNQGQAVEVTQTVVQVKVDVEEIMRQVSHMTRVMVSQAESSIEMQLNPANLGKVYLQVVSRQGVITAQIAAQNEAVKEALENQVALLKENMNQQGMKVEAIEVTIASHEFERNLEQNQQDPSRQQEEEARQASRRNINLNSLDELEGLMSEEESLVAKIMSEQGNSVNLTA